MKTTLLYLLLFSYSVNLVKPVLPYVKDTLSHILWYSEHAATVHVENGKYHVHIEALQETKKTGLPKNGLPAKTAHDLSEHVITQLAYDVYTAIADKILMASLDPSLIRPFFDGEYPPPRPWG